MSLKNIYAQTLSVTEGSLMCKWFSTLISWYVFSSFSISGNDTPDQSLSHVRLFATTWTVVRQAPLCPWNSPGENTGVGSLSLLQGIFLTQESNRGLLHYRQILYQLSYKGNPRILEWVAYPFSSRSSQPRNQTGVSCIAGRFFTSWATREAQAAGSGG